MNPCTASLARQQLTMVKTRTTTRLPSTIRVDTARPPLPTSTARRTVLTRSARRRCRLPATTTAPPARTRRWARSTYRRATAFTARCHRGVCQPASLSTYPCRCQCLCSRDTAIFRPLIRRKVRRPSWKLRHSFLAHR